jgi:hypothetical protein
MTTRPGPVSPQLNTGPALEEGSGGTPGMAAVALEGAADPWRGWRSLTPRLLAGVALVAFGVGLGVYEALAR